MNQSDEIAKLKNSIPSSDLGDKRQMVDRLIELEGMKAMNFFQSLLSFDPFQKRLVARDVMEIAGYGVRQLIDYRARQSTSEFKFCPFCAERLEEYPILDPYAIGLKCSAGHRFHIDIKQNDSFDTDIKAEKKELVDIAKEWLTNKDLRRNINSQIAEILRKYVELYSSVEQCEEGKMTFAYCPVCSSPLEEFDQDDVWVNGLKCKNGHDLYSRKGLRFNNARLEPDLSTKSFYLLVNSYLTGDQKLPDQILRVFTAIKSNNHQS